VIYLDSAATTLQKPPEVRRAVLRAMLECGNPGRGGHKPSMRAAQTVFACREAAAELFGIEDVNQVVFTMNATHALNIAIHSLVRCGGHAVISGYEHNSVVRPLESNITCQFSYTAVHTGLFEQKEALEKIEQAIRPETDFIVCTVVSNVFGYILPYREIDELCAARGIGLVLDMSQAAGAIPIDCGALKSRCFCCMPGHKGLYGPQGTGILLCLNDVKPISITQGGTGSNSLDSKQPDFLPDMLESGTLNVHGIAGLLEGIRFVQKVGPCRIGAYERALCRRCAEGLGCIPGIQLYTGHDQGGVLAFRAEKIDPQALCERMADQGVCLRGGLHCAPLAHRSAGTLPDGTVRISFSAFNRTGEIDRFLRIVDRTMKSF